jgi:hypothetical protein
LQHNLKAQIFLHLTFEFLPFVGIASNYNCLI